VDCDRGAIPQEGESEERLWQIVGPREQERVSAEFAEQHLEFVRDAILDAQDSPRVAAPPGPAEVLLGRRLWREWIGFRDHALRELRQRGQLAGV
jgi:hypothetical protein